MIPSVCLHPLMLLLVVDTDKPWSVTMEAVLYVYKLLIETIYTFSFICSYDY